MWDDTVLHDLTAACSQSDAAAQRAWYTYSYAYGITVALYYSSKREEAEEVLQDSYVKVFAHFSRGQPAPVHHRPWFRRIIINTAIDYYRRQQQQRRGLIVLLTAPVCHNRAVETLDTADLYRLVQCLPPTYRMVFNLHVLEGYSHPEIARRLRISVGTSKSNLHKARTQLQRLAGPYFNLDNELSNA